MIILFYYYLQSFCFWNEMKELDIFCDVWLWVKKKVILINKRGKLLYVINLLCNPDQGLVINRSL